MLDPKEIDIEIARLEYGESSYPAYAKLANLYTIREQIRQQQNETTEAPAIASYSAGPAENNGAYTIDAYGDSDFLRAIEGRRPEDIWSIMDELMDTLQVANPRVYNGVMRKIRTL